jgi:hypothetical protein
VLDELLATRADLRELAETHAARLMSNEDRSAVARDVANSLRSLDIEELNGRAGYRPGQGYVAVGILLGLYECRHGHSELLLEYSPDYAAERAADVVDQCANLGIALPGAELLDLVSDWDAIVG